jgi:hypothetical protein
MKSMPVLVLVFASACSLSSNENKSDLESRAEHVSDCCKLEGPEIGREDALLRLGTKAVLVHGWVGKTGESNEYVGFSLTIDGGSSIKYVVKAAGERHSGSGTTWMHPNGPDGGSDTPGISNLDFCGECDDPDGCGDDVPPTDEPDGPVIL